MVLFDSEILNCFVTYIVTNLELSLCDRDGRSIGREVLFCLHSKQLGSSAMSQKVRINLLQCIGFCCSYGSSYQGKWPNGVSSTYVNDW